jgi:hypothetical protein
MGILELLQRLAALGFGFDVWVGTGVPNLCYSAESALLHTRGLELARPNSALLLHAGQRWLVFWYWEERADGGWCWEETRDLMTDRVPREFCFATDEDMGKSSHRPKGLTMPYEAPL